MNSLFPEYQEITPILTIGSLGLVKYKKPDKKKRGITNERQVIMQTILDEVNKERQYSGIKPLSPKVLAITLSHIPTEDLYFMNSSAKDYRVRGKGDYGKYIFGSIKVKK